MLEQIGDDIKTDRHVYRIFNCEKYVLIMTHSIAENGYLIHENNCEIDKGKIDSIIERLQKAKGK